MILSEYKDIIKFAMQNEIEAQKFPEKKQVFMDLAAMEQGHKQKMENAFVDIGYPEVW